MKKQKVQLPGHQQAIVPPTVKPPAFEDEESNPTASSSNDPTIPLPTTTPHSFTPSPAVPEDTADYDTLIHLSPEVKRQFSIMIPKMKQKNLS